MSDEKKVVHLLSFKDSDEKDRIKAFLSTMDHIKGIIENDKLASIVLLIEEDDEEQEGTVGSMMIWNRAEDPELAIAKMERAKIHLALSLAAEET